MITNKTQSVVDLINTLIREAMSYGDDIFGHSTDDTFKAVEDLIECLGLSYDYKVIITNKYNTYIKVVPRDNAVILEG